jgi:hypothetical protein
MDAAVRIGVNTTLIVLPGLAFAAYYYHVFTTGVWSGGQFKVVASSPFAVKLIEWGFPLPFATWGYIHASPAVRPIANILGLWIGGAVFCSLLPFWQSDRFTEGLNVGSGALFALGLLTSSHSRAALKRWFAILGLGAISQYLYLMTTLTGGTSTALYHGSGQQLAMEWVAGHSVSSDVVFAPLGFGNALPTVAKVRVVAGHGYQTLDFAKRTKQLQTVYGMSADTQTRLSTLRETGATLVVFSKGDLEDGSFTTTALPAWRLAYQEQGVTILRVNSLRLVR